MKPYALALALATLTVPLALPAQTTFPPTIQTEGPPEPVRLTPPSAPAPVAPRVMPVNMLPKKKPPKLAPLSRLAVSVGISDMGGNVQVATNLDRYINLRATGNYFDYTANNISISGYTANGTAKMATGGASVDFYPFPNHGFRLSPGVLFYNKNALSANVTVTGGTKITLNGTDYYSSTTNPIVGAGTVNLHNQNPAFTMTTGWGNMISRTGGHWSFPFELGVALVGAPQVNLGFTSGQACNSPNPSTPGTVCVDVSGPTADPVFVNNLNSQIAKYDQDINMLKYYPILSFGVSYNFAIRRTY